MFYGRWVFNLHLGGASISFPESLLPLTSGRKTRALGALCTVELDGQNLVISFVILGLSFSDRWSRGTKSLGTRLGVGHSVLCQMEGMGHVFSIHHIFKCSTIEGWKKHLRSL